MREADVGEASAEAVTPIRTCLISKAGHTKCWACEFVRRAGLYRDY